MFIPNKIRISGYSELSDFKEIHVVPLRSYVTFQQANNIIVALLWSIHCPDEIQMFPSIYHNMLNKLLDFRDQDLHLTWGYQPISCARVDCDRNGDITWVVLWRCGLKEYFKKL